MADHNPRLRKPKFEAGIVLTREQIHNLKDGDEVIITIADLDLKPIRLRLTSEPWYDHQWEAMVGGGGACRHCGEHHISDWVEEE